MRLFPAGLRAAAAWMLATFVAASTPRVVAESEGAESGLVLSWPADAPAVARLAVPPAHVARVASVRDAAGRELPAGAVDVLDGRFRRLPTASLLLDEALRSQVPGPWRIDVRFVAAAGGPTLRAADVEAELELLRSLDVVNADAAPRYVRELASSGSARMARAKTLGEPRVKIGIDRDGLRRVTHEQLAAAGVDATGWPVAEMRLMSRGTAPAAREIAMHVQDAAADGTFGPGDWFEFWGEALVGEDVPGAFQRGDFTDVNAYFLDLEPGSRLRMTSAAAAPDPGSPQLAAFLDTARWERDDVFIANTRTGIAGVEHFYACPTLDSGATASRTDEVALPGLASGAPMTAALRARLLARTGSTTSPDHVSEIVVSGSVVSREEADGPAIVDHAVAGLSPSLLSPATSVTVRLPALPGGERARADLDWIEIAYPRAFAAVDGRLTFRAGAPARVTVTGVAADAAAFDVTDPARPVRLTGVVAGGGALQLEVPPGGVRKIAVTSPAAAASLPAALGFAAEEGLADPAQGADLLVIAPRAWTTPALPGLSRYVAWREAQGLRVRVASVEAAVDELNDGLFSPAAISHLVTAALDDWATAPRWVLLLGDATVDVKNRLGGRSVNPSDCSALADPCGFLETEWVQHVPTHLVDIPRDATYLGYLASDSLFAMGAGDDWMPDVALGRIPARTGAEIETLLDKVVAYESLAASPPAWARRFVTVADEVVPGQETIETSQDAAAAFVPDCYARETLYYQREWGGTDAAGFTAELLATWTDPSRNGAVMSYVGHGNTFRWSADTLLTNQGAACRNDVEELDAPGTPLPVLLNADCVAGGFMHLVGPSLLEELVRSPDGGAIAAIGPTGVTDLAFAEQVVGAFYEAIYGPRGRGGRLGEAWLQVQAPLASAAESGSPEMIETNVLLGDPSLQLVIPFGPPAGSLQAVPDAGGVSLTWSAVPGATAYRIYRSVAGEAGPWTVAADAITATGWRDDGAAHGVEVHYALEPLEGCLPGRWSAAAAALPCDPAAVPAAPSAPAVLNTDCDGDVLLQWTPSATPGVSHVLRARRAGTALPPERTKTVTGSFALLDGLVPFREYWIDVAAVDECGQLSSWSPAVTVRITCPLALDPPAMVRDLRVARQGSALALSWSAVTTTLQGSPLTPSGYDVHASADPAFDAAASVVSNVPAPAAVLAGRVGNGVALEFFAVAAVAASGAKGPVGHALPQGVRGLFRDDTGADYELTWRPVTHDVDGLVTPIDRYEVHASPTALTRNGVVGRTPDAVVTDERALLPQSLGGFHVVVAVDVHGNRSAW